MAEPNLAPTFFHRALAARAASATDWYAADALDAADRGEVARRFLSDDEVKRRMPFAVIEDVFRHGFAHLLLTDLRAATFVRHPHGPYPLDVARFAPDEATHLAAFCRWLSSPESVGFHLGLCGWGRFSSVARCVQVQASRMTEGQRFPMHVDTDDEGIAVVYQLSPPELPAEAGGVLRFRDVPLEVRPRFNSLALFRSRRAWHEVTPIVGSGATRYSVTAFILWTPQE